MFHGSTNHHHHHSITPRPSLPESVCTFTPHFSGSRSNASSARFWHRLSTWLTPHRQTDGVVGMEKQRSSLPACMQGGCGSQGCGAAAEWWSHVSYEALVLLLAALYYTLGPTASISCLLCGLRSHAAPSFMASPCRCSHCRHSILRPGSPPSTYST